MRSTRSAKQTAQALGGTLADYQALLEQLEELLKRRQEELGNDLSEIARAAAQRRRHARAPDPRGVGERAAGSGSGGKQEGQMGHAIGEQLRLR
jgi:hypothetical protein